MVKLMESPNSGFVPFNGVQIPYVFDGKTYWVAIRAVCESIGFDHSSAIRDIKNDPNYASTVVSMTTVAEDKKQREMLCLPIMELPFWLSSINANRVKLEARETLIAYRKKCSKVLFEYFFGSLESKADGKLAYDDMARIKIRISELKKCLEQTPEGQELKQLKRELKEAQVSLMRVVDEQFGGEQLRLLE
jgi:hypothetical protein